MRADSGGATHRPVDYCREGRMFSVGYELTEPVRAAILTLPEDAVDSIPTQCRLIPGP